MIHAAPAAVRATVAWQAAEALGLHTARWRLAVAWPQWQAGDPVPWDAAVDALIDRLGKVTDTPAGPIWLDRVASEHRQGGEIRVDPGRSADRF